MRTATNEFPFSPGLALGVAPILRWEIRRAPRQRVQRRNRARRRFRNQTVFPRVYLEYFSHDRKGGVDVRRAIPFSAGAGLRTFRVKSLPRMSRIQFWTGDSPLHEASKRQGLRYVLRCPSRRRVTERKEVE